MSDSASESAWECGFSIHRHGEDIGVAVFAVAVFEGRLHFQAPPFAKPIENTSVHKGSNTVT
jgi:hypothetical protein